MIIENFQVTAGRDLTDRGGVPPVPLVTVRRLKVKIHITGDAVFLILGDQEVLVTWTNIDDSD